MTLSRRHALVLAAVAAWNVLTYAMFAVNLAGAEGRPAGYYVAHTLLIVVNVTVDTISQIQSHLLAHQYEGLIKKSRLRTGSPKASTAVRGGVR